MLLRKRMPDDQPQVLRLLAEAGLPPDGLELTTGWVVELDGALQGHVALEATADAVVLRSLAVSPARRGSGLGALLLDRAEGEAEGHPIYLKTDTVGPWMLRRGYLPATLGQAPDSVRRTTQFSGSLCAGTPIYFKPVPKEDPMQAETIKAAVRQRYAGFVTRNTSCCGGGCGCSDASLKVGYDAQDLDAVPDGANLGLGCGNPLAMAALVPGETVLDLGSGAGFDAFLAARQVGPEGRVIGVDMTPEMIARARALAEKHGYTQVEFRQGDIEALPVDSGSVDSVISNCVINLTTDKAQAFREAFRVLKPGARLMVSDLVLLGPLPESIRRDMDAYAACISGALPKGDYLAAIRAAGFTDVEVVSESRYDIGDPAEREAQTGVPTADLEAAAAAVVSLQVKALKPR